MKLIKFINKLAESFLWFYLPVVLLYQTVLLISISAIAPLKAVIGYLVNPAVNIIKNYFNFQLTISGHEVDYSPTVLAVIVFVSAIFLATTDKLLKSIESIIQKEKLKAKHKSELFQKEKEKQEYINELEKNKTIYVMLKLSKITKHASYLVKEEKDPFSIGVVDSYETTIVNIAQKFNGKIYNGYKTESNTYNLIFTDINKVLNYIPYLINKIEEINRGTADLNTIFTYNIACNCSYSQATADTDLSMTEKLLKLCTNKDILITELLKDKLHHSESEKDCRFESKGIYHLSDKFIDIYKLIIR